MLANISISESLTTTTETTTVDVSNEQENDAESDVEVSQTTKRVCVYTSDVTEEDETVAPPSTKKQCIENGSTAVNQKKRLQHISSTVCLNVTKREKFFTAETFINEFKNEFRDYLRDELKKRQLFKYKVKVFAEFVRLANDNYESDTDDELDDIENEAAYAKLHNDVLEIKTFQSNFFTLSNTVDIDASLTAHIEDIEQSMTPYSQQDSGYVFIRFLRIVLTTNGLSKREQVLSKEV